MENIHSSWNEVFYKHDIVLETIYDKNKVIYPKNQEDVFKVFKMDVKDIKVVLLGQDPYYANENQAHGFSFSVPRYTKIPPSLKNIFTEIGNEFLDRNYKFKNGDLTKWFENEKIFLLNCSLTVEKSKVGSHMSLWNKFTNDVIKFINDKNKNCVYILLGNFAHNKMKLIDKEDHINVIKAVHPSPLSAYRGFFNSNIFKNVEKLLGQKINWQN